MVIPQAMACGLPVITTKNTGGSEIIDNDKDGFVIPIRSKNFKRKITFLYNNPSKCLKMGMITKTKLLQNIHGIHMEKDNRSLSGSLKDN